MPHSPNVVILGKSNDSIDNEYLKDLISSVDPNGIPKEFIHRVFVIDQLDNRYVLPDKFYKNGIMYKTLSKTLDRLKIDTPIYSVEIVIDLLVVKHKLDIETNEIFSNIIV